MTENRPARLTALWTTLLLVLPWLLSAARPAAAQAASRAEHDSQAIGAAHVTVVTLHDTLQPVSAQGLHDSLAAANARHPDAILLDLSTPGGWADSAAQMADMIRRSPAPVIVYLRETGTQIGGEGLRLLAAAPSAAMSPHTELVSLPGLRRGNQAARRDRQLEREALAASLDADMRARGRDPGMLRELFWDGAPIRPLDAQNAGLIQDIAMRDEDAVRSARFPSATPHLQDPGPIHFTDQPMSSRDHLMRALMNPDLIVLLITLGALLIFLEINTPGTVLPGAAGVLLVLLSAYGLWQMPLRWQGVALLMTSCGLLLAETQFARGSTYGVGAVVALTLGLRLLVRGPIPQLEVDWSTSLGAGIGFGGITAGLVLLGVRARRAKVRTGADAMIGWLAVAQTPLTPAGEILVRGELWRAHLSAGNTFLDAGETVKVQAADGMTLEVAPMTAALQDLEHAS